MNDNFLIPKRNYYCVQIVHVASTSIHPQDDTVAPIYLILDTYGFLCKHQLAPDEVIFLCGVFPVADIKRIKVGITSTSEDIVHIRLTTNLFELSRTIDLESLYIVNHFMLVYEPCKGLGTQLLLHQINAARLRGILKLKTTAFAPYNNDDNWSGYYCWGRLGYRMTDPGEQYEFNVWAKKFNRDEPSLNELLLTEDGRMLWRREGFTWIGEFDLTIHSPDIYYFKRYLAGKRLITGISHALETTLDVSPD